MHCTLNLNVGMQVPLAFLGGPYGASPASLAAMGAYGSSAGSLGASSSAGASSPQISRGPPGSPYNGMQVALAPSGILNSPTTRLTSILATKSGYLPSHKESSSLSNAVKELQMCLVVPIVHVHIPGSSAVKIAQPGQPRHRPLHFVHGKGNWQWGQGINSR